MKYDINLPRSVIEHLINEWIIGKNSEVACLTKVVTVVDPMLVVEAAEEEELVRTSTDPMHVADILWKGIHATRG